MYFGHVRVYLFRACFWTIYPQCAAFARLRGAGALPGVPSDGRATEAAQNAAHAAHHALKRRTVPSQLLYKKKSRGSVKVGIPFAFSKPSFGDDFGDSSPPTATYAHRDTTEHRPRAPWTPGDADTVIFTGGVSLRPRVQNPPRNYIRKARGVLQKSASDSLSRKGQ